MHAQSCALLDTPAASGRYPMRPRPDGAATRILCDMDAFGGGFTLVGVSDSQSLQAPPLLPPGFGRAAHRTAELVTGAPSGRSRLQAAVAYIDARALLHVRGRASLLHTASSQRFEKVSEWGLSVLTTVPAAVLDEARDAPTRLFDTAHYLANASLAPAGSCSVAALDVRLGPGTQAGPQRGGAVVAGPAAGTLFNAATGGGVLPGLVSDTSNCADVGSPAVVWLWDTSAPGEAVANSTCGASTTRIGTACGLQPGAPQPELR